MTSLSRGSLRSDRDHSLDIPGPWLKMLFEPRLIWFLARRDGREERSRREERGAARCSPQVNIATTTSGGRSLEFYGSLGSRCICGSWLSEILAIRSNELSELLRGWLVVMKFCSNRAIDANIGVEHSRAERSCGDTVLKHI